MGVATSLWAPSQFSKGKGDGDRPSPAQERIPNPLHPNLVSRKLERD